MSVLTKIFVVLVTVCSIALVAMTIAFVARTENYVEKFQAERGRANAAEQSAQVQQGQSSISAARHLQDVENLTQAKSQYAAELAQLQQQLSEARNNFQSEKARNAQSVADLAKLAAAEQQHAQLVAVLNQELDDRRKSLTDAQTKYIESTDRVRDLTTQVDTLDRQNRRHVEVREEQARQIEDLSNKIIALGHSPTDPIERGAGGVANPNLGPRIEGAITEVRQSPDGGTLASIDRGADAGVRQNMTFLVHRGNQFVGTLVINVVQPGVAAGRIEKAQGRIAVGDTVFTGTQGG